MIRPLSGVLSGNPSGTEHDNFDRFLARLPNGSASLESGPTIEVRKRGAVRGLTGGVQGNREIERYVSGMLKESSVPKLLLFTFITPRRTGVTP